MSTRPALGHRGDQGLEQRVVAGGGRDRVGRPCRRTEPSPAVGTPAQPGPKVGAGGHRLLGSIGDSVSMGRLGAGDSDVDSGSASSLPRVARRCHRQPGPMDAVRAGRRGPSSGCGAWSVHDTAFRLVLRGLGGARRPAARGGSAPGAAADGDLAELWHSGTPWRGGSVGRLTQATGRDLLEAARALGEGSHPGVGLHVAVLLVAREAMRWRPGSASQRRGTTGASSRR